MSDSFAPLLKNAVGRLQRFGGEQTLTWDFTSAAGNPMELVVGGSTYFTFTRTGGLTLESNILWNTDSGGTIGAQYATRPSTVNVATTLAVGAVTAVGDGAKLTLNRLTLGHADVDKYIDAEQGLASTPFLRYNATHHRWEYTNDGITVLTFGSMSGVSTWDDLYTLDKTLAISTTPLIWTQTSATGVGFSVTRGLAAASTDSPLMTVEQTNAADDQPPLALGQSTTTASALDIYEGTVAGGTIRFGFGALGRLNIVSNAASTTENLRLEQNAATMPFLEVKGTAAAGAGSSISTDANPTADMLQVEVDTGGGANKRWIPAYAASTLPGAPSWDSIYASDKILDIDTTALQFIQTSTSGYGFELLRNLDLTNTDLPIVHIQNQNTGDDQSALFVEGTIDNAVASASVARFLAVSAGLSGGAEDLISVKSTIDEAAADAGGAELFAYYAEVGGVAGAAMKYGYYAAPDFSYGVYARSPMYVEVSVSGAGASIIGLEDTVTSGGVTGLLSGVTGHYVAVAGHAADDVNAMHSGVDLFYAKNASPGTAKAIHVDGPWDTGIHLDSTMTTAITVDDGPVGIASSTSAADALSVSRLTAGNIIATYSIVEAFGADRFVTDNNGTTTLNAINATSAFTIGQNSTGDILELKDGSVAAGDMRWVITEAGAVDLTPADPTAPFDAYTITMTSGGLDNEAMRGLVVDLTGLAGDLNTAPVYGADFTYTTGGGSNDPRAVNINDAWNYGVYTQSPVYVAPSATSGVSAIAVVQSDLDKDGVNITSSAANTGYGVNVDTNWAFGLYSASKSLVEVSSASAALVVAQAGVGAIIDLMDGTYAGGTSRLSVLDSGYTTIEPLTDVGAMDINCTTTDVAGDISGVTVDVAKTAGTTVDGRNIWGLTSTVYAHAADATVGITHQAAYRAVLGGVAPAFSNVFYHGLYAEAGLHAGLWSYSPCHIECDASATLLGATLRACNLAAVDSKSFVVVDGDIFTGTDVFAVYTSGKTRLDGTIDANNGHVLRIQNEWDTFDTACFPIEVNTTKTTGAVTTTLLRLSNDGVLALKGHNSAINRSVLNITQLDVDSQFIDFAGSEAADQVASISSVGGDGPNVVGPHDKTTVGWAFAKMVQIEINGSPYWIAAYSIAP